MWRSESAHLRSETTYLDAAIEGIERDQHFWKHAEAILTGASAQEPLIAQSLRTPQDVRFHAEGPFMRDHVRLMLMVLTAVAEEKLHLIDIEEFRRMKGYEGEVEELEETLKEHASFFQAFAAYHDVTKWLTVTFTSAPGSRGEALGFVTPRAHHLDDAAPHRAAQRQAYLDLYTAFAGTMPGVPDREAQAQFYLSYSIQVHYPHHARKIHAPVYEALLDRVCAAHSLTSRDRDLLDDLTAHHMEFNRDFQTPRAASIRRYLHLAQKRGYDADDFLDLLQGCLFLDGVVGSKRLSAHGYWHDVSSITNALIAQHAAAPQRREAREVMRQEREKRERTQVFHEVGLDGTALMDLLEMEPGREFGEVLRQVQAAVVGEGEMPRFTSKVNRELDERAARFYGKVFKKGE